MIEQKNRPAVGAIKVKLEAMIVPTATPGNTFMHAWKSNSPVGVADGMDGTVYVTDTVNHCVRSFTSEGVFIRQWGKLGSRDGEFFHPFSLAIDVRNGICKSIVTAMKDFVPFNRFPPGLLSICAAYIGEERLYVADMQNHRIQVFSTDGKFIRKWGSFGRGDGQFRSPKSCCVDTEGIVYVTDTGNHRIQAFHSDGTFILKWGSGGRVDGQFWNPVSITASQNGLIYIADRYNCRVVCCRRDGTLVHTFHHTLPNGPASVVVNSEDGIIYVADSCHDCIYQHRMDGSLMRKFESSTSYWNKPHGMALGVNGMLYVADRCNNRVVAMYVRTH